VTGVDNSRSLIDAGDLVLLGERPPNLVAAREERDVLDNVARLCQIDRTRAVLATVLAVVVAALFTVGSAVAATVETIDRRQAPEERHSSNAIK
jgi:hypothetical protein